MRWKQDAKTGKLIPIDEAARRADRTAAVSVNNFDAFVSPVDGTLIRNMRDYREHNRRNNVVPSSEFSPEFIERKAKERADFFTGNHSRQESIKRKQELYERMVAAERNHNG